MVTATIAAAFSAGVTRQRVRVLLTRDPNLYATRGDLDNPVAQGFQGTTGTLVPPDEQWQGGIMELYYSITPVVKEWLRTLSPSAGGLPPRLVEARLDECKATCAANSDCVAIEYGTDGHCEKHYHTITHSEYVGSGLMCYVRGVTPGCMSGTADVST